MTDFQAAGHGRRQRMSNGFRRAEPAAIPGQWSGRRSSRGFPKSLIVGVSQAIQIAKEFAATRVSHSWMPDPPRGRAGGSGLSAKTL
jgi:hypothetical protein